MNSLDHFVGRLRSRDIGICLIMKTSEGQKWLKCESQEYIKDLQSNIQAIKELKLLSQITDGRYLSAYQCQVQNSGIRQISQIYRNQWKRDFHFNSFWTSLRDKIYYSNEIPDRQEFLTILQNLERNPHSFRNNFRNPRIRRIFQELEDIFMWLHKIKNRFQIASKAPLKGNTVFEKIQDFHRQVDSLQFRFRRNQINEISGGINPIRQDIHHRPIISSNFARFNFQQRPPRPEERERNRSEELKQKIYEMQKARQKSLQRSLQMTKSLTKQIYQLEENSFDSRRYSRNNFGSRNLMEKIERDRLLKNEILRNKEIEKEENQQEPKIEIEEEKIFDKINQKIEEINDSQIDQGQQKRKEAQVEEEKIQNQGQKQQNEEKQIEKPQVSEEDEKNEQKLKVEEEIQVQKQQNYDDQKQIDDKAEENLHQSVQQDKEKSNQEIFQSQILNKEQDGKQNQPKQNEQQLDKKQDEKAEGEENKTQEKQEKIQNQFKQAQSQIIQGSAENQQQKESNQQHEPFNDQVLKRAQKNMLLPLKFDQSEMLKEKSLDLQQNQDTVNEILFKIKYLYGIVANLECKKSRYLCLGDVIKTPRQRKNLMECLSLEIQRRTIFSEPVYSWPKFAKHHFHEFIGQKAHYLLLVRLKNGMIVSAYSQQPLGQELAQGKCFICQITNKTIFKEKESHRTSYDHEAIIFGNNEVVIKQDGKIKFDLGKQEGHFSADTSQNSQKVMRSLNNETQIECYEIWVLHLSN